MAAVFDAVAVTPLQNGLLLNAIAVTHHPGRIVAGLNGSSNLRCCRRLDKHEMFNQPRLHYCRPAPESIMPIDQRPITLTLER